MPLSKRNMPETLYRSSRLCCVLGNPTAYLIVRCLGRRRKTPTDLSGELDIPLPTISWTLRHLRQVDLVRYETKASRKEYWVKEKDILTALDRFEGVVERTRKQRA